MKKLSIFFMIVVLISIFSSCSVDQPVTYTREDLSQYTTSNSFVFGNDIIVTIDTPSSGGSKFFLISPYTDTVFPLCFDPVCNHISDDCPSVMLSGNTLFNYTCDSQYMYYAYNTQTNDNMNATKILQVDLSTASRKEIVDLDNRVFGLKYVSDYLYFIENNADTYNQICRFDLKSHQLDVILNGADSQDFYDLFCVYNNMIYYLRSEHDGLYEYNIKTGATRCISDVYVSDIFLNQSRIFLSCIVNDQHYTKVYDIQTETSYDLVVEGNYLYGVLCVIGDTLYYAMSETIPFSMPQDAQLLEILGDEASRHAFSDRFYSNTNIYEYDLKSGSNKLVGSFDKHTIYTMQIFNGRLYIKGNRANDLGNGYISLEDFSGYIDLSKKELKYIKY